jgi:hypothetical protein
MAKMNWERARERERERRDTELPSRPLVVPQLDDQPSAWGRFLRGRQERLKREAQRRRDQLPTWALVDAEGAIVATTQAKTAYEARDVFRARRLHGERVRKA